MNPVFRLVLSAAFLGCCSSIAVAQSKGGIDDLLDSKPTGKAAPKPTAKTAPDIENLLERKTTGSTIRLVALDSPEKPLVQRLFWHTYLGAVAGEAVPAEVRLGDEVLMASQLDDEDLVGPLSELKSTVGNLKLAVGKESLLSPGKISLRMQSSGLLVNHPAIKVAAKGAEIQIACAPVRFESLDEQGRPAPSPLIATTGGTSLLRRATKVTRLTLWLPVGLSYVTSFGNFSLAADGKIVPAAGLPSDVKFSEGVFRRIVAKVPRATESVSELLSIKANKTYRLFASRFVRPGEPLYLAVLRKEYADATNEAADRLHFSLLSRSKIIAAATETPSVPQVIRSRITAELGTSEDVAIFQLPVATQLGGNTLTLGLKHGGSQTHRIVVSEAAGGLYLISHRHRSVFTEQETPVFHVLVPQGCAGGKATIAVTHRGDEQKSMSPMKLGELALPAVTDRLFDARGFELRANHLPAGDYQLHVTLGDRTTQPLPLTIVPWRDRSSFHAHAMMWGGKFPETEAGIAAVHQAGLQTLIQGQQLQFEVPTIPSYWKSAFQSADLPPPELALERTYNDMLLERLLRHQIRHVDFAVTRIAEFYNEGLSYHHSYQPSVDRMIRRLQIFTQQTADYPSAAGINYSWFPRPEGYVEAGVPWDAHVAERNRVLQENVLTRHGVKPLTKEEREFYLKHRKSTDPAEKAKAEELLRQATLYWKANHVEGFAKHNELYNQAVRQIRPDAINTLYENAGHDAWKRPSQMFHDMAAAGYFTMTDYGDWPMSAGFTTDWARGQVGNQAVWLTSEFLNSVEGQTKNLFHAFARGLDGGGMQMSETKPHGELLRRGQVINFLAQYGSVAKRAKPDRRLSILSTHARQMFAFNGTFAYHAALYHFTRLGVPPGIVSEDELQRHGVPDEVEVLALVNVDDPLPPLTQQMIQSFQKRGGRVLVLGNEVPGVQGAVLVDEPLLSIWRGPGFQPTAHAWMWEQFAKMREPLVAALQKVKLAPRVTVDSAHGYALTMDDGPLRYVAVIADRIGTHVSQFEREPALRVGLEGEGWKIRDLRTQTDLAVTARAGRSEIDVELVTEPATLLVMTKQPTPEFRAFLFSRQSGPSSMTSWMLGDVLKWRGELHAAGTAVDSLPIRWRLFAANGEPRGEWFRAVGDQVSVRLAELDQPGTWRLEGQELLTGGTVEYALPVRPAASAAPTRPLDEVHVSNTDHLAEFASAEREGERLILLEPGQESLRDVAENLAKQLQSAKVEARVWQLRPEDFDTQPNRWFLRPEDETRQQKIDLGNLIGVRRSMQPFIDKLKAVHLPEKGGYPSIAPDYIVNHDAIVFSGGQIAESLRVVTSWLDSPHVPGKEQGRIVVAFSPFQANRLVATLVAHDHSGFAKSAERLAKSFVASDIGTKKNGFGAGVFSDSRAAIEPQKISRQPVPRPLTMLVPHRRVDSLLVNEQGAAAVVMQDGAGTSLVDAAGKFTAAVPAGMNPRLDNDGRYWDFVSEKSKKEVALTLRGISATGDLEVSRPAFDGTLDVPGSQVGFGVSPTGKMAAFARHGEILFGPPADNGWSSFSDAAHAQERFAVFYPRLPISMVYSSDGRFLGVSLDTRPPINNMSGPLFQPTHAETILFDLQTGQRVWTLRDRTPNRSTFAAHRGFLAVARDGRRTALADYDGNLFVVNQAGELLFERRVRQVDRTASSRLAPTGGVGVSIADNGSLAAFAFQNSMTLVPGTDSGKVVVDLPLQNVEAVVVTRTGSHAVVASGEGTLIAFRADGTIAWQKETGAAALRLAAGPNDQLFVGTGAGDLLVFDSDGNERRRTSLFDQAKKNVTAAKQSERTRVLDEPRLYSPPETLATAQKKLGAKLIARWEATGSPREAFGQSFFPVQESLRLAAATADECIVHLVYRRPADNRSLSISTSGRDGKEMFELDLPTPIYRSVDIPVRGPKIEVSLTSDGPVEVAEFSLWSLQWPGANLLLVQSATSAGDQTASAKKPAGNASDDILGDLNRQTTSSLVSGKAKTVRVWWPNTDPDRLKGRFLPSPADPLAIVDGRRFGNGQAKVWSAKVSPWGASVTVEIGQATPISLVSVFDRARRQSDVVRRLMVFSGSLKNEHDSPPPLAPAAMDNDQFWRLFSFAESKVETVGVHTFAEDRTVGLSEVEAYR